MVSCLSFATELECALHYTNEYNVKLFLLGAMFVFIGLSLWYSRDTEFKEDHLDMFKWITFKSFPTILLVFSPFFLLMLKNEVSLDLVIRTITMIYFIMLGLFIGLALIFSKEKIYYILGDRRDIKHKLKHFKK